MFRSVSPLLLFCCVGLGYVLRDVSPVSSAADAVPDDEMIVMIAAKGTKQNEDLVQVTIGDIVFRTQHMTFIRDHEPNIDVYATNGNVITQSVSKKSNVSKTEAKEIQFGRKKGPLSRGWRNPQIKIDLRKIDTRE